MICHVTCNKIGTFRVTELTGIIPGTWLASIGPERHAPSLPISDLLEHHHRYQGVDGKGPGLVRVEEVVAILGFARLASMERVEQGMASIVTL
jgi:hypothetical protein